MNLAAIDLYYTEMPQTNKSSSYMSDLQTSILIIPWTNSNTPTKYIEHWWPPSVKAILTQYARERKGDYVTQVNTCSGKKSSHACSHWSRALHAWIRGYMNILRLDLFVDILCIVSISCSMWTGYILVATLYTGICNARTPLVAN